MDQALSALTSKSMDDACRRALGASQDAWRKYRDSETDLEGSFYEGGTIQRQIKLECMTRMTKERTRELRKLLNDESDR